jgi:hypothetical protein
MQEDTTKPYPIHSLRHEARMARLAGRRPVTVNVDDAIFTRLVQAEELLTVAVGLFIELSENKANWLFRYQADISDARWALREVLSDRSF